MSVAFDYTDRLADHVGPWTVDDVLAMEENRSQRFELLGDMLMMSPAPAVRHQWVSYQLHRLLDDAARSADADVVVLEGINVTVPSGLVVPDIAVVDLAAFSGNPVSIDAEAVLLVVEIASPGNRVMDRRIKPAMYSEAGIPRFWRLEFSPSLELMVGELKDGKYVEEHIESGSGPEAVLAPFPVEIDLAALTADPRRGH